MIVEVKKNQSRVTNLTTNICINGQTLFETCTKLVILISSTKRNNEWKENILSYIL